MVKRLAIFDLDGVLIDSELTAATVLARCLSVLGCPLPVAEVVDRFIGIGIPGILAILGREKGRVWPPGLQAELEREVEDEVLRTITPTRGIRDALAAIPPAAWCVASNSSTARMARCLAASGIAAEFSPPAFSASAVARGKPAPDLFLHAAATLHVAPAHCMVVEDTVFGVAAGKAAGMVVVGYLGGSHMAVSDQATRLRQAGATAIVSDGAALVSLLREFFAGGDIAAPAPL